MVPNSMILGNSSPAPCSRLPHQEALGITRESAASLEPDILSG